MLAPKPPSQSVYVFPLPRDVSEFEEAVVECLSGDAEECVAVHRNTITSAMVRYCMNAVLPSPPLVQTPVLQPGVQL